MTLVRITNKNVYQLGPDNLELKYYVILVGN